MTVYKSAWAIRMDEWQTAADALQARHRHWGLLLLNRNRPYKAFVSAAHRLSRRFNQELARIPTP